MRLLIRRRRLTAYGSTVSSADAPSNDQQPSRFRHARLALSSETREMRFRAQSWPFTFVRTRARFLSAVMYSVLPSSPNATFAVGTPVASVPRCLPAGE